jgi:5-oxoprolinase (ATP-hydrolysing)/N-methylhydantoinase A
MSEQKSRWRIGFDIGGTFTDFVLFDERDCAIRLHKRLTTPHDPAEAAITGLEEIAADAGIALREVGQIVHGTTLVTNAVIERKGAKLGLVTTRGFRDMLEAGREQRYNIYDLFLEFPEPLAPRQLRLEVTERIDRDGRVQVPLDPAQVRSVLNTLIEAGVQAVAVCFINAYRNAEHEALVGRIGREEFPQLEISLSSEVVAEIGEYERSVTTCANAYVQPLMDRYLGKLESALASKGFQGSLYLMHSAGGLVTLATARAFPIRLLESGPAGGALATALFGRLAGQTDVIAFDMGGTTAKACLIAGGEVEIVPSLEAGRVHRFANGSGLPIKTPTVDLIEIGAGGGSIATVDEVGLLKVGPHSAGSDPGPACYGMGGAQPTVTDANLLLGYYDPAFFLGGRMKLDKEAAQSALAKLAALLSLSPAQVAWGIHQVVVESMAAAARVYLVEKGLDPRRYAMVGFGGAGPAHACDVARVLGVKEVIIPPASGAASALGFLTAPLSFEVVRSHLVRIAPGFDAAGANRALSELEQDVRARLVEAGVADHDITVQRSADMRLAGQTHNISVPLPEEALGEHLLDVLRATFNSVYTARYTAVFDSAEIDVVNLRVRAQAPASALTVRGAVGGEVRTEKLKGTRPAWFAGSWVETRVYDRYALAAGDEIRGPAIIEEREATTVIAPGDRLTLDSSLNLRIAIAASSAAEELISANMSLAQAIARIESNPIALEIMWSRLVTVTEEMWSTVRRTAFSNVISDAQDFACELLGPDGEPLVHSPRSMPAFNLSLPRGVKAMLELYPPDSLVPGDVLICNDPWLLAGHLYDIAIVTPVFKEKRLVGLTATVGHVTDIGGTKNAMTTQEIFEEGLQIPPMKLFEAGRPNETLLRLLKVNVRGSEEVVGDLYALVAANEIGARRLVSFMDEYGMADLRAMAAVVQGRSERAMRKAIAAIPDGVYQSESWTRSTDAPLRVPLTLSVIGDRIELDFAGAPPQLKVGAFNSTLSYASAAAVYPLKCLLTPGVRGNAGCYRPFTVKAPPGSILNCTRLAPVSQRTRTGWYIAPTVFQALAQAIPERVQAFSGVAVNPRIYGLDAAGRTYSDIFFSGGGQGASASRDGRSALLWPTSAANTSIEQFEARVPVLVLEKGFIPDSGGAGRYRGGLAQRVRLRKLLDDGLSTLFGFFPDPVTHPGLFGGKPGLPGGGRLLDDQGRIKTEYANGAVLTLARTDEVVEVTLAGGSGYGNPLERDRSAVARDLQLGLISARAAVTEYGI